MLVAFSLIILACVGFSTYLLYHNVTTVLTEAIHESVASQGSTASIGANVVEKLSELQMRSIAALASAVLLVTLVAGYVVTKVALSPTRNALESQKQFIGNVAHELRTPLSNIKTETEVALLDVSLPEETRTLLGSTLEELGRISDIINNLLSLSASVRPERMEFRDEDIGTVVENSMRALSNLASTKQLDITARLSERRVVWGNAAALEQIVSNILKNAIMYTPRGGHISVTVEPVYPDFIELTIRDSGVGIAHKDLFRIFEPYFRAERSRNRARGGAGLGLTIVSELVKLHQGKITARSIEKQGTTISVLLPAGRQRIGNESLSERGRTTANEISMDFSRRGNHSNSS